MRMWKWIGLAGVVGAAAIGVAAAGNATVQRRRREFIEANPDELRDLLHARWDEARARQAEQAALLDPVDRAVPASEAG